MDKTFLLLAKTGCKGNTLQPVFYRFIEKYYKMVVN